LRPIRDAPAGIKLSGNADATMPKLEPLNLQRWIDANRSLLRPPVGNRLIFRDGEFIVMAVGGPNSRQDYHVDPAEEIFHQVEGDMVLRVMEDGRPRDVPIRAGEMLLLPPRVPHSPQRPANTVGIVIERQRRPGELDGLQWYCAQCDALLYEEYLQLADIETQFPPVFDRFYAGSGHRQCRRCGSVFPLPPERAGARTGPLHGAT
jgi:3-hydroxyanthranilate 3,4-dioxygenase